MSKKGTRQEMKLLVVLGTILFAGGASLVIYNWVYPHYARLPREVEFVAILLMVIPVVALIGWVIWKVIRKL